MIPFSPKASSTKQPDAGLKSLIVDTERMVFDLNPGKKFQLF